MPASSRCCPSRSCRATSRAAWLERCVGEAHSFPAAPPRFLRTLTGKTLLRLALAGGLLLLAAAAFNALLLYRQSESEATLRLAAAAAERARVAERVLGYTVETHETVRQAFVEKWPAYQNDETTRRFETLLALYPDGIWRNRRELADGHIHPTGWIPKRTPLTE